MDTNTPQIRILAIYRMLIAMALGNLHTSISYENIVEEIDSIETLLKALDEKLRLLAGVNDNVGQRFKFSSIEEVLFILDFEHNILDLSDAAGDILEYTKSSLRGVFFTILLSEDSQKLWQQTVSIVNSQTDSNSLIKLIFKTSRNKKIPILCAISLFKSAQYITVSSISVICESSIYNSASNINPYRNSGIEVLPQQLHDYILNHLHEQLPATKDLAQIFGTNEFKLKDSFRKAFQSSIYQFYNDERLKKSFELIIHTNHALNQVAYLCGFNDYMTFFKAFKKKYKYPPSSLKRPPYI